MYKGFKAKAKTMAKQAFARESISSSFHRSTAKLKLLTMNIESVRLSMGSNMY
jgi:hypothetical protein